MDTSFTGHTLRLALLHSAFFLTAVFSVFGQTSTTPSTHGALILQSPVQAVASINGQGAFLLIPEQNLQWSKIAPGTYRISMTTGSQQWEQSVQIQPGQTETVVATLASPGAPLSETSVAPSLPVVDSTPQTPAATIRKPSSALPAATGASASKTTPSLKTQQNQQKEDTTQEREALRKQQEDARQQRESEAVEQRIRQAEARALRESEWEEQRRKTEKEKADEPKKTRRPKVH